MSVSVSYVITGAGGGGGSQNGQGGFGGLVVTGTDVLVSSGSLSVVVGAKGTGVGFANNGNPGSGSSWNGHSATGGAGGAGADGNAGGDGAGGAASGSNGGAGTTSPISSVVLGAGGGGVTGTGGTNAGDGAPGDLSGAATSAAADTGAGGGGGNNIANGGDGADGRVELYYATGSFHSATGGSISTVGGNTVHTFTGPGTYAFTYVIWQTASPSVGTATIASTPASVQLLENIPRATLAITGLAPTRGVGPAILPGKGAIAIATTTPGVNTTITVPPAAVAIAGIAPLRAFGFVLSPGTRSLTFTGLAPTISAPNLVAIQLMLDGVTWTDVSNDVRQTMGINLQYGMQDARPTTLVAPSGQMTFWLDNSAVNTAGKQGYYAPSNANARAGFVRNIPARIVLSHGGVAYYKFVGRIKTIDPLAGKNQLQYTACTVVDYMDDLARANLTGIPTQIGKRFDQMLTTLLSYMATQPTSTNFDVGTQTFPYGLVGGSSGVINGLQETVRLAASEQGYVYMRGNTTAGGELRAEAFGARTPYRASVATLIDAMGPTPSGGLGFSAPDSVDDVWNACQVTVHPRQVSGSIGTPIVLYTSSSATSSPASTLKITAGQSVTINAPYRDPSNPSGVQLAQVAGVNMVNPVATTDYTAFANADGTGTNLTGSITITPTFGATGATLIIANSSGTDAFMTKLQVRGVGLFDYDTAIAVDGDSASQTLYGTSTLTIDMPYASDPNVGQDVATLIVRNWKAPFGFAKRVTFLAGDEARLAAALQVEVGDRVSLAETVTGISASFIVNGIVLQISEGPVISCTWILAPVTFGLEKVIQVPTGTLSAVGVAPTANSKFSATGGTITTQNGFTLHTFDAGDTFTVLYGHADVNYAIIAGGGGAGNNGALGGGGGAGGVVQGTFTNLGAGSKSVVVGAGGPGGTDGTNGGDSSITGATTAIGGGAGSGTNNGSNGGCGGGAGDVGFTGSTGGLGSQGFSGGNGVQFDFAGAGGGGMGSGGTTVTFRNGGAAGAGIVITVAGASVTVAAGGGGGGASTSGAGGSGIGGNGGNPGTDGAAGTGSGGGAGGGNGGRGRVYMWYTTP